MKILVLRLSALGDILTALPLVDALRESFPQAEIDLGVQAEFASLFRLHPGVDRVLGLDLKRFRKALKNPFRWPEALGEFHSIRRRLRLPKYDAVLDAHGNFKSGILSWLSGAPLRVGPNRRESREGNGLFQTAQAPASPVLPRHRSERALSLLACLGVPPPPPRPGRLEPRPSPWVESLVRPEDEAAPWILIHPGASPKARFKAWPARFFGALGLFWRSTRPARISVVVGPGEEDLARDVVQASEGLVENLGVAPSLPDLLALLARVDVLVSNDSGPAQMAPTVGTPVLSVFGPKAPATYAPLLGLSVRRELDCAPCGARSCRFERVKCLEDLPVRDVARGLEGVLETGHFRAVAWEGRSRVLRSPLPSLRPIQGEP